MKESMSAGEQHTHCNNSEAPKGSSSSISADLPLDMAALVSLIESLRETNTALMQANEFSNSVNESYHRTIQELTRQNAEQSEKINELIILVASMNEQLKKIKSSQDNDSSNSNLPPSASNPSKSTGNRSTKKVKKNYSLRKNTQEKPGRLPGHEGSSMKLKTVSDRSVDLFPEGCTGCEHLESCMLVGKVCDKRFTVDIVVNVLQTEYKRWKFHCPHKANQVVQGLFPQHVTGSKQYGPNIKNYAVLLKNIGFVSYKRMAQLCSALGIDVSAGTLLDICNRFAGKCKHVKPLITSLLQSSPVLGVDETGGNINGTKAWHHDTVSEDATLITSHRARGLAGTLAAGVMQNYSGVVVHDFWSPYFNLDHVHHAMCVAHLERENNKALYTNQELTWPMLMNNLFHDLQRLRKESRHLGLDRISQEVLLPYLDRYDDIVKTGVSEDPFPLVGTKLKVNGEPRKPAYSKAQNLLKRYMNYQEEILRFTRDFDVPVSNNFSERGFRMLKVAYNVFGCFRTTAGAENFSMMQSVFDTGRKQGMAAKDIVSCVSNGTYLDIFNAECRSILMANCAIPTTV